MCHRSQQRPPLLGLRSGFSHGVAGAGGVLGPKHEVESHLQLQKASSSLERGVDRLLQWQNRVASPNNVLLSEQFYDLYASFIGGGDVPSKCKPYF